MATPAAGSAPTVDDQTHSPIVAKAEEPKPVTSLAEKPSETTKPPAAETSATGTPATQTLVTEAPVPAELDAAAAKSPVSPTQTTTPTSATATAASRTATNDANGTTLASSAPSTKAAGSIDENVNPPDFAGEVETNNDLPSQATLRKLENHTVLDADGKSHTFKSIYSGHNVARRVLVIFIRHFFCGNCQEYLRTLALSITPEALLRLPVSTFVAVIGCGAPKLINSYIAETGCPFPVYADETQKLYSELGMVKTWAAGSRPAYMQNKTLGHTVISGIMQGLKQVKSGLVLRMGDQRQVGGEFLFEPAALSLDTPISTPQDEVAEPDLDARDNGPEAGKTEEKRVTWCHRMRTTRDHAEVPELMEVLGLDGLGQPIQDQKRWEKALRTRKGTGLSMASQMSRMSTDVKN